MRTLIAMLVLGTGCLRAGSARAQDTTEVVILGVNHSAMLVAETYRPAVFRAYFDRVGPDAICVERAPAEFARGSHYEFTYEIQNIAVPYARSKGLPVCPFDWLPAVEDQLLAFGVDLAEPPFLRGPGSYATFHTFTDSGALQRDLFYAEAAEDRAAQRAWYGALPERPRGDFARRLFLYRTFMQSMRIARAARQHAGGRLLVLVGSMHKDDLERILKDQPGVRIVAATQFGRPTPDQVAAHVDSRDMAAIATFNLLGAQSATGTVDWDWMRRILDRLQQQRTGPEVHLLQTRLAVLTDRLSPAAAAERYAEIAAAAGSDVRFTWDGVLDRRRLDSYADPFANLTVRERAVLEQARELYRAGRRADAARLRDQLAKSLTSLKAAQLMGYWAEWIAANEQRA